jgi:hypothetical protein
MTRVLEFQIMTVVLERMDESLVVASRYLGWSIADVVAGSSRSVWGACFYY